MTKVHHNTAKKAKVHGITLTVSDVDGAIIATLNGKVLAEHLSGSVCLEQAIAKLNGAAPAKLAKAKKARKVQVEDEVDPSDDEIEAEGDEGEGKSIIRRKYKSKYKPFKMTCGDDLATLITKHVTVMDDEIGEYRVDKAILKHFAQANECWRPEYARLNVGMQRLNIGNRLRARVRKGIAVKWTS